MLHWFHSDSQIKNFTLAFTLQWMHCEWVNWELRWRDCQSKSKSEAKQIFFKNQNWFKAAEIHVAILSLCLTLTWSFFSWLCLVVLSDRWLLRTLATFSVSSNHWARFKNLWPICLSRVSVEWSWARFSSRRLRWAAHSRFAVSRARSSIWGIPQGMTLSLLVSTDASKDWPLEQFSCRFWEGNDKKWNLMKRLWDCLTFCCVEKTNMLVLWTGCTLALHLH